MRTSKRSSKKLDHVASVRTRGGLPCAGRPANRVVQQPSKMAHAREQWPGMARLNRDRTILSRGSHLVRPSLPGLHSFLRAFRRSPLGVWVGEGLKEEIAGERGGGRASQTAQRNILLSSSVIVLGLRWRVAPFQSHVSAFFSREHAQDQRARRSGGCLPQREGRRA